MSLRRQLSDRQSTYPDPVLGVNLRDSYDDLQPGQARSMQNIIYDGGTRIRTGSTRLTPATLEATKRIRGGHRFYYGSNSADRLVAYGTRISRLDDLGAETIIDSGMSDDLYTHFLTWPITDKCYIVNGQDPLKEWDGTTFQSVSVLGGATNVPGEPGFPPLRQMAAMGDRLWGITINGVERTEASGANIWSFNTSWSTLRPWQPGLFKALVPHTVVFAEGERDGLLAIQPNAYYFIYGTKFGTGVNAASPPVDDDTQIQQINGTVGTESPFGVAEVPDLGTFWITTDANVWWVPKGGTRGRFIADNLFSNEDFSGLETANPAHMSGAWLRYFNRRLYMGIPTFTSQYPDVQWWLDLRSLQEHPDRGPVWHGPMTGQSVGTVWTETANQDNRMLGGEGNAAVGAFVYELVKPGRFLDAVGLSDLAYPPRYRTFLHHFGTPSKEKYVRSLEMEANAFTQRATLSLFDVSGTVEVDVPIEVVAT